jgi:DNA-binding NarL/FixJ family response regulator
LLLLKGLSHKEAAATRATSETTIRQQALAIYRKSGLRNRSELGILSRGSSSARG